MWRCWGSSRYALSIISHSGRWKWRRGRKILCTRSAIVRTCDSRRAHVRHMGMFSLARSSLSLVQVLSWLGVRVGGVGRSGLLKSLE